VVTCHVAVARVGFVCCVLCVACCVLCVACCVLCVVCCVLRVACCVLLRVACCCVLRVVACCCVLCVACCVLHVACCVLHVACCVLHVASCVLRVMCVVRELRVNCSENDGVIVLSLSMSSMLVLSIYCCCCIASNSLDPVTRCRSISRVCPCISLLKYSTCSAISRAKVEKMGYTTGQRKIVFTKRNFFINKTKCSINYTTPIKSKIYVVLLIILMINIHTDYRTCCMTRKQISKYNTIYSSIISRNRTNGPFGLKWVLLKLGCWIVGYLDSSA
jgi:hypothetical protein